MATIDSFQSFFDQELAPLLAPLEVQRKKLARLLLLCLGLMALTVILFITASSQGQEGVALFAFLALIATIMGFVIYASRRKKYVKTFKETIVRRVIAFIDPTLHYNPAGMISEVDYKKSGLFLVNPDRYDGDDYVEGKRDKTIFSFSELHSEQRVNSGKNTTYVTIFKGLFFIADFNKHFSGRTYAWSERNPQLNFFNRLFSSFSSGLEKVKLESPEFERRFVVYSNDQVEARYILTPSMMERMIRLQDLMGEKTTFSFVDTNVYVAVPIRNDLFEPSFFRPNDYLSVGDYYNTIHIVFDIIDELNLNLRIWTKD